MTGPLFPEIEVQLSGNDGNAFAILGNVSKAMRRAGVHKAKIEEFLNEAESGDYNHLLATCAKWVEIS